MERRDFELLAKGGSFLRKLLLGAEAGECGKGHLCPVKALTCRRAPGHHLSYRPALGGRP